MPRGRRVLAALRDMLFAAERTWLDVRCPVFRERVEALRWRPDTHGDYCARCGQSVGPHDMGADGCRQCSGRRLPWSRIVRLGAYRPPLTRLVHEVKFTRWKRLGWDLGALLAEAVAAALADQAGSEGERASREIVVVPVPMSFRRRLRRGIDHSGVLGRAVASRTGGRFLGGMLRRDHRASQLAVQPSERARNVAGTIHPRRSRGVNLGGRLVVVVDDVTTTGATLRATCRAIAKAHRASGAGGRPAIWVAVVAVTELEAIPATKNGDS